MKRLVFFSGLVCALGGLVGAQQPLQPGGGQGFVAGPSVTGAILEDSRLLPGTSILRCEGVSTDAEGAALLARGSHGGEVVLGHSSNAVVLPAQQAPQLWLQNGYVAVTGAVGVHARQAELQPLNSNARYAVLVRNGVTYVTVQRGDLRIANLAKPRVLHANQTLRMTNLAVEDQAPLQAACGIQFPARVQARVQQVPLQRMQKASRDLAGGTVTQQLQASPFH